MQENVEDNGNSSNDTPSDGSTDTPKEIVTEVQGEAAKFIGQWIGRGPGYTTQGTWTFRHDGTYEWHVKNYYGYGTTRIGRWEYIVDKGILSTDNEGWNWQIENVDDDHWIGTVISKTNPETHTYVRNEAAISMPQPYILDYLPNAVELNLTINNYFLHSGPMKIGICYGAEYESDFSNFRRIYVTEINKKEPDSQDLNESVNGITTMTLSGLISDTKYRVCGFVELSDGTSIYGETNNVISPTLPDVDVVYMGDAPSTDGYVYLWATNDLNTDGTWRNPLTEPAENKSYTISIHEFDKAIASLGNGWSYPTPDNWRFIRKETSSTSTGLFGPQPLGSNTYYGITIPSQRNDKSITLTFMDDDGKNYNNNYIYSFYFLKGSSTQSDYYPGPIYYTYIMSPLVGMYDCKYPVQQYDEGIGFYVNFMTGSSYYSRPVMRCRPVYKAKVAW